MVAEIACQCGKFRRVLGGGMIFDQIIEGTAALSFLLYGDKLGSRASCLTYERFNSLLSTCVYIFAFSRLSNLVFFSL
jgi:hypothetical protein